MSELNKRYLAAKRALFDRYYSDLNDMQKSAVCSVNGPLLILAGAGSGKTTVLVRRITHIIKYGNAYYDDTCPTNLTESRVSKLERAVYLTPAEIEQILPEFISDPCPPYRMLAITFTNKAANEIKERLAKALDDPDASNEIWAGTFHSMCMRILRANTEKAGLSGGFTVYDTDDTKKAIQAVMKELMIDDKMIPLKTVANYISRSKEQLKTPEMFALDADDYRKKQIARIYEAYQKRLNASNALDFDDIIMRTVFLLRDNRDVLERYSSRFRYVSVDEFQDTNSAQFLLTNLH